MTVTAREGLEARNNLQQIAAAWPALHAALRPGSNNALTGMPGTSPERPAPINLHISDLIHEITTEAEALAHTLMDETVDADGRPWQPRTSAMPQLLEEVAEHWGHWTAGDDHTAHAFTDWAHHTADRVRNALTRPEPARYIGPCGIEDANDIPCDGSLYLKPGSAMSRCRTCGAEVEEARQRDWIAHQFEQHTFTQSGLVSALLVLGHDKTISTINGWIKRGDLQPAPDGRYPIAQALQLATRKPGRPRATA